MAFPALSPSARDFNPGNWPIKTYTAQSGAEVRILYGDTRSRMELSLSYDNISDSQAEQFLTHYDEVKGTYTAFDIDSAAKDGWTGSTGAIDAGNINKWRYADAPQITAVRPGRSSVKVNLVGVF